MLKRLSFTSDSTPTPHLAPPLQTPSSARTPLDSRNSPNPRSVSPSTGYPFPATPSPHQQQHQVERTTLHKSLTSLSALLVALDEYRSVAVGMARAERKVAKLSRELATTFGEKVEVGARSEVVLSALAASAGMFEALAGVDAAHSKVVQREYEAANDLAAKFFKRVAKEEKGFDDALATMDAKASLRKLRTGSVEKSTAAYEKSRPRARPSLADAAAAAVAHDKYMASLSSLSSSIATLKRSHAESMGDKRERAGKEVARIVCGLAEVGWKNRVEATRKGGEKAGEVVARGVWCETGMPSVAPEEFTVEAEQHQQVQQQQQQSTLRGPRPLPLTNDSFVQPQRFFPTSPAPQSSTYPTQLFSTSPHSLLPPTSPNQLSTSPHSSQPVSPAASAPPSPQELPTRQLEPPPEPQPYRSLSRKPSTSSLVSHQSTFSSRPLPSFEPPPRAEFDLPRPAFTQTFDPPPSPSAILRSLETQRVPSPQPVRIVPAGPELARRDDSGETQGFSNLSSEDDGKRGEVRGQWREEGDPRRSAAREEGKGVGRREGVEKNESTASERSFVARMRERYVEEKEREKEDSSRGVPDRRPELPAPIRRSNSRVADLAQRYTSPPSSDYPPHQSFPSSSSSGLPRPTHRYSHSMQPLQSTDSTGFNEFGQRGAGASHWTESRDPSTTYGSPPPTGRPSFESSRPSYDSRSYSRPFLDPAPRFDAQSQYAGSNRSTSRQGEPHPDFCGCEKCSENNYKETGTTREEEERRQKELRSVGRGNDRRMSMPVVFGGGRR